MANGIMGDKNPQDYAMSILNTAVLVITRPVDFYREMQRSGGFVDPLIFLVVMGLVGGILQTFFALLGLGYGGFGLSSIIIAPIVAAIFGFVGAAIVFGIWKLLGSTQSYEVAYRCAAYGAAISPLTTLVQPIPYLGALVGIAWGLYLMVIASTEVHEIEPKKAYIVFGVIGVILAFGSLRAEHMARSFVSKMSGFNNLKTEEMTPEEAGKKVGEFMKGLQKGAKD
ncbi:MAG: YIP1 family protein [Syntrophobacter sp.]